MLFILSRNQTLHETRGGSIVEIRDAMIDPRITFDTTRTEIALLERAESHLLGRDQAVIASPAENDEDGAP